MSATADKPPHETQRQNPPFFQVDRGTSPPARSKASKPIYFRHFAHGSASLPVCGRARFSVRLAGPAR